MTKKTIDKKEKTSFSLSSEALSLLLKLSELKGLSKASTIELLIRESARKAKLK